MLPGSSAANTVAGQEKNRAKSANQVLVCLDCKNTYDYVLEPLRLDLPLVSSDSYMIVFYTDVGEMPGSMLVGRPWSK